MSPTVKSVFVVQRTGTKDVKLGPNEFYLEKVVEISSIFFTNILRHPYIFGKVLSNAI
jgi:hypothetical protein